MSSIEFNGETDHVHPLVAYPPTLTISTLAQRLKGRTAYAIRREFTGACVRAPHAQPPVVAVLRTSPTSSTAALRPATHAMGSPPP